MPAIIVIEAVLLVIVTVQPLVHCAPALNEDKPSKILSVNFKVKQ